MLELTPHTNRHHAYEVFAHWIRILSSWRLLEVWTPPFAAAVQLNRTAGGSEIIITNRRPGAFVLFPLSSDNTDKSW